MNLTDKFPHPVRIFLVIAGLTFVFLLVQDSCSFAKEMGGIEAKLLSNKVTMTNVKLPTLILLSLAITFILILPRRDVLMPFIISACFVPTEQRFILDTEGFGFLNIINGLDFTIFRMLVLSGFLRIFLRRERTDAVFTRFDMMIVAWALVTAAAYILCRANFSAIVNRCGALLDLLGIYFIMRFYVTRWSNVLYIIRIFAIGVVVGLPFILYEWNTGYNPFVLLGNVATDIRAGEFRCQGAHAHPIMMGVFWVTLLPLFIGMSRVSKAKPLYALAVTATVASILASNSSTPIGTALVVGFVLTLYGLRRHGKDFMKLTFMTILAAQLIQTLRGGPPVWHIFTRIDLTGSSTGWHRYHIIEQFVRHFSEWWLFGTRRTASWDAYGTLADVTNEYVAVGVNGGLLALIIFFAILIASYKTLLFFSRYSESKSERWFAWCLLTAFIAHLFSFFGVSYFGQMTILWYFYLAVCGFLYQKRAELCAQKAVVPQVGFAA